MNFLLVQPDANLFLHFLESEEQLTLIDTTGDIAVAYANRTSLDAVYLDPADTGYPVGLNVFDGVPDHQQFTEQLTDYIYQLFPAGTNTLTRENTQFILENVIRLLLVQPEPSTLLSVLKFLKDASFRDDCLRACKDPVVLDNWTAIEGLERKTKEALFFSLRTKVGKLLMEPMVRNIVGQPYTLYDAPVVIANLDRQKIGNARAKFLGGLLITQAKGRVVITDYSFFNLPLPFEQNRFTVGIHSLEDFSLPIRSQLLNIPHKSVFSTTEKDAEIFKRYVGVPEAKMIMDLDPGQYRTEEGGPFFAPEYPSLNRLKALRKKTRACHTAGKIQVERNIKRYLA